MNLLRRAGRELQSPTPTTAVTWPGSISFADTPSTPAQRRLIDAATAAPTSADNVAIGTCVPTNNTFNLNGTPTFTGEVEQGFATTFGGLNAAGNWTLTITDWALNDLGNFNSCSLTVTSVPEPGTFALCGVGLAGPAAYRASGAGDTGRASGVRPTSLSFPEIRHSSG
jgi:hypothetical protein